MSDFKLFRPLHPTLNYPNNNYKQDAHNFSGTVSQRYGDNFACVRPDGSFVPFGAVNGVCPVGSESIYIKMGMLGHNGIDVPAQTSDKIYAAHDGIVSRIETDNSGGIGIRIITVESYEWNGQPCRFETLYWHCLPTFAVKDAQSVKAGDLIGFVDNTGLSSGPHLHWGLKPKSLDGIKNLAEGNGYYSAIDPLPYLVEKDAWDFRKEKMFLLLRILTEILHLKKQIVALKRGEKASILSV